MDEDKKEVVEETEEESIEEDIVEEKVPEYQVNNEQMEILNSLVKRLDAFEEKLDNAIAMIVDSGGIIQDVIDDRSEKDKNNYADDFIDIDKLDLSL